MIFETRSLGEKRSQRFLSDVRGFSFSAQDGAAIRVRMGRFRQDRGAIVSIASPGHDINVREDASFTVMMPTEGQVSVRIADEEHAFGPGEALAFPPTDRQTKVAPSGNSQSFHAYMLKVPISLLRSSFLVPNLLTGAWRPLEMPAAVVAALGDLIRYGIEDLAGDRSVLIKHRSEVSYEVLVYEHLRHIFDPVDLAESGSGNTTHRLARAIDFIRHHFREPISSTEIAEASGIGERALQRMFVTALGRTPFHVVSEVRMDAARERLLNPRLDDTVTAIALECGFTHLGRFSRAYRSMFAESPSETLNNHRR